MARFPISRVIASAAVVALSAASASADPNTQEPNPSAQFGHAGSADDKLDAVNDRFGTDYDQVGSFMSEHVGSYGSVGPGRSGLSPNSENANSNAGGRGNSGTEGRP